MAANRSAASWVMTGLVGHHVLAVCHGGDRNPGVCVGNGRSDDQRHRGILEKPSPIIDPTELRKLLPEGVQRARRPGEAEQLAGEQPHETQA